MVEITVNPLTESAVDATFQACQPEEVTEATLDIQGVVIKTAFSISQLEAHQGVIESYLSQVHPNFRKSIGGGWSFLQLCQNADDQQWADLQLTMDKLVCLGKAIGKLSTSDPQWNALMPGGMPYVFIDL